MRLPFCGSFCCSDALQLFVQCAIQERCLTGILTYPSYASQRETVTQTFDGWEMVAEERGEARKRAEDRGGGLVLGVRNNKEERDYWLKK
ncbi:unnamed protein product [Gongylonema pulchrum]|uniref:Uncharacterized protein n=1 Tax=Gongylonema pulchrum TaxID=637853 RepID=A0A183DUP8_9BILA|nr:unnamed protein product [Gongylonema pulchrum]